MVSTEEAANIDAIDDLNVVDIGAQIQETTDDFLPYVGEDTAGHEFLDLSRNPRAEIYGGPSAYPLFEYKRADEQGERIETGEITEAIHSHSIDRMREEYNIKTSIINPTLNLGISEVNNDRFALAMARGYNRWLVSELDDYENLLGNMVIAPQNPEQAANEIDEMADEKSIVGILLPVAGMLPPAGHRMYTPIYEAAARHGLPITLQGTVGIRSFHQQVYSSNSYALDYVYQQPFLVMQHLTSLMFEGVLERFSTDIVLLDSGIDLAPYLIMRLDDHYLELGYEIPVLDQLPSAYCQESVYWGTAPSGRSKNNPTSDYLAKMVRMIGAGNVLYSSDIPHPVTESPASLLRELAPHLDAEQLDAVFGETAADIFAI